MSPLLEALETLVNNGLPESAVLPIVNDLFESDGLEDDDDVKVLALLACRAEWESDVDFNIEECSYDDCQFEVAGNTYMVLDEDEKEQRWDDQLESFLDECVEGADGPYFDRDAWKRDARFDGAGHCLSPYDGSENEVNTGNTGEGWYFIFRTG